MSADPLIDRLVRHNVKTLTPYKSARSTVKGSEDLMFMDAAENPFSPFADNDELSGFPDLNRYPEPQPSKVIQKFAALYGVKNENILVSRGSEEGIRLLLQVFCEPRQDSILTCPPTFAMYTTETAIHDVENVKVPRIGTFHDRLDLDKIGQILEERADIKMIFLCNPCNPASTSLAVQDVEALLKMTADRCIVVVDEAYIEFAAHPSFAAKLDQHKNLVVLRTLSKAYGLAALRCGCILAAPEIISYISRITAPYPVPLQTAIIAEKALSSQAVKYMQDKQAYLKEEREYLKSKLPACKAVKKLYPSQANFLCVVVEDSAACVAHFKAHGIVVRDRSAMLPNAVNIAVGTRAQNEKIIAAMETFAFTGKTQ